MNIHYFTLSENIINELQYKPTDENFIKTLDYVKEKREQQRQEETYIRSSEILEMLEYEGRSPEKM